MTITLPDILRPDERLDDASQRRLDRVVREAAAIELFRQGRLGHRALGEALQLDRHETDALLQRHGIEEQTLTTDEIAEDAERLGRFLDAREA